MALPVLLQKLFKSSGYGPELNDEIVSRYISVQDWSNAYDYPVNTLARGSDGLLYWSVAQSGPGVAAGVQNPTADDGTYWQAPRAMTMPPLEDSEAVATTRWSRLAFGSMDLYVDGSSGSDAGDGLSQATAVKTIGQALTLARGRIGARPLIHVAAGTYSEDVVVDSEAVEIDLQGAVSIAGSIAVTNSGILAVSASLYTLSLIAPSGVIPLSVTLNSAALFYSALQVAAVSSRNAILCSYSSHVHCSKSLSVSCTNLSDYAVSAAHASSFDTRSGFSIGTGASGGVMLLGGSYGHFVGGIQESGAFSGGYGLYVDRGSSCYVFGAASAFYGGTDGVVCAEEGSCIEMYTGSDSPITLTNTVASTRILTSINTSTIYIVGSSGQVSFAASNAANCIYATQGGCIHFSGSGTLSFSGSVANANCEASVNGCVRVAYGLSVSGTMTGKRYNVERGGQISVAGAGANRFPGSTAGTATTASFGYYS